MPTTVTIAEPSLRRSTGTRVGITADEYFGTRDRYHVTCEHGETATVYNYQAAWRESRRMNVHCAQCAATASSRPNRAARRAPAAGQRMGDRRRFGVEFEFFGIRRSIVESWLQDSGLRASGWKVVSDCSVHGEGLELVSPPLSGPTASEQVRTALAWLNENGARVDRTCGTHVHLDLADVGIEGMKRFAKSYVANQELIDWLVAPSRRQNSGYCRPYSSYDIAALEQVVDRYSVTRVQRYLTVNVQAFGRHGTVEVRQHQGTLNATKILTWIDFLRGMLDTVAETGNEFGTAGGIKSLVNDFAKVDDDTAAFLLGRAIQFDAPVERVAA